MAQPCPQAKLLADHLQGAKGHWPASTALPELAGPNPTRPIAFVGFESHLPNLSGTSPLHLAAAVPNAEPSNATNTLRILADRCTFRAKPRLSIRAVSRYTQLMRSVEDCHKPQRCILEAIPDTNHKTTQKDQTTTLLRFIITSYRGTPISNHPPRCVSFARSYWDLVPAASILLKPWKRGSSPPISTTASPVE
ncbi:hypothetical protein VTI28DRAFT_2235 [Corynascus sepedonium]